MIAPGQVMDPGSAVIYGMIRQRRRSDGVEAPARDTYSHIVIGRISDE